MEKGQDQRKLPLVPQAQLPTKLPHLVPKLKKPHEPLYPLPQNLAWNPIYRPNKREQLTRSQTLIKNNLLRTIPNNPPSGNRIPHRVNTTNHNTPRIRSHETKSHLHKRTLTRPIRTQQRVDNTRPKLHGNTIQDNGVPKPFGHALINQHTIPLYN
ncbi:hypothetical protein TCARB_1831 [Thermofilum adornatum 1505]|uniref:Uncharacterized protein n=1 Tax=Thermofilum adornatum 1505 TaxID=697581 RepID=A0A3G1AA51_9CREN|nr:hypothetical protein TCARB_1831 [Thermofilum adornatum 1505]